MKKQNEEGTPDLLHKLIALASLALIVALAVIILEGLPKWLLAPAVVAVIVRMFWSPRSPKGGKGN